MHARGTATAVIVNYRTPQATLSCVNALIAAGSDARDIIVVDNGSGDDSTERLSAGLAGSRLITTPRNLGFAAGSNLGIREAFASGGDLVFLVNSDAEVRPGTVEALTRALERDSSLGIVGPVVVSRDTPQRIETLGIRYSRATGRMRHLGWRQPLESLEPFETREVDGISGCAMLIRREVFDRVGTLDEEYFFGFEDLEFCLRAGALGLRCACVGSAVVVHERNRSIGRASSARVYYATRNHLRLVARDPSVRTRAGRVFALTNTVVLNLAHVLFTAEVRLPAGMRGYWLGVRDHFAGRYGPGPAELR
jgi:GT2 family glycosyltransferase